MITETPLYGLWISFERDYAKRLELHKKCPHFIHYREDQDVKYEKRCKTHYNLVNVAVVRAGVYVSFTLLVHR